MTRRVVLLMHRHLLAVPNEDGVGSKDLLQLGQISIGYVEIGKAISRYVDCLPASASAFVSEKNRVRMSSLAALAGAFGVEPVPQTESDLNEIDFPGLEMCVDPNLSISYIKYNEPLAKKIGDANYAALWIDRFDDKALNGEPSTSAGEVLENVNKVLGRAKVRFEIGKRLVVLGGHLGPTDLTIMSVANTGREHLDFSVRGYGGLVMPGNFAVAVSDYKPRSGRFSNGKMLRNGEEYNVNFNILGN